MAVYSNTVTGGLFGMSLVFLVFIISYMGMSGYGAKQAFPASSFLAFISSVFLRQVGLISDPVVILLMITTAAAVLFMTIAKDF